MGRKHHFFLRKLFTPSSSLSWTVIVGNLSNDDGDANENCKKAIGLDWQNNNFARASRFFVHFVGVIARLRRENALFITFCGGRQHKTTTFFFFS